MEQISMTILCEPVAKGRARYSSANGYVRAYTPAKTRNAEALIQALIREEVLKYGMIESGIPLKLEAIFYRERPKHLPKRITMPVSKPDVDNYIKTLLDSLNKYLFPDDNQITTVNMSKRFGSPPRIELKISEDYIEY